MSHRHLIARIIELLDEHYIDRDVTARMAATLRDRYDHGLDDEQRLCEMLTADLRRVSGDQHLTVRPAHDGHPDTGYSETWRARLRDGFARDNHGFTRVAWLDGGVGLLELTVFSEPEWAGERAVAAMTLLADANALIVDVRHNRGGAPAMVALLTTYLVNERTLLHTMRSRDPLYLEQSWTLPWLPGPRFGATKPIWVLTSSRTFSGGEEFAYNLQALGRATIVGEVTAGAAHPITSHLATPTVEICLPGQRPENPSTGTNWEGVGVIPDITVPADTALDTAHQLALTHLQHQTNR